MPGLDIIHRRSSAAASVSPSTLPRRFRGKLNEARFGYRANKHVIWARGKSPIQQRRKFRNLCCFRGKASPSPTNRPRSERMSTNNYVCMTTCAQQATRTRCTTTPTRSAGAGKHSFKAGADVRYGYTSGSETPTAPIPRATGGQQTSTANQSFAATPCCQDSWPRIRPPRNQLLSFQSGSVASVFQYYFLQQSEDLHWDNYMTVSGASQDHRAPPE
jgi:hypothetical protein